MLALVAALAGCTSTASPGSNPSASTLVVGATLEPQSLDITASDGAGGPFVLLYNVYETLVKINPDGQLVPLLASSWTVSDDRLTYTFPLRSAKFSDGNPVTADAVVSSFQHIRTGSGVSATLKSQMAAVKTVTAPDDHTVVVTLSKPSNLWLYWIAGPAGIVVEPSGQATVTTKSAGSGPYVYSSWKKGDSLTLSRNGQYWGNLAHFGEVTFKYYTDANALTAAMLSGGIDVISDLTTPDALGQFSDTSKYTVTTGTTNGEVVLGFNHQTAALKDLKVRQAINYAIDRKALVDSVWGGQGQLIGSMVPPTDPYYEDLSGTYSYDVAKAKALLKASGHASGLTLRLRVPPFSYATGSATFVAASLKAVGITVKVEQLDFNTWLNQVFLKGDYDLTVVNHVEPRDIVKWANSSYYWHYSNAQFNKLIAAADAGDQATFIADMRAAAKILSTDAAADFLFLFPHIAVSRADITGIAPNAVTASFDLTSMASRNG